jgi:AT hook motif
VRLAARKAHQKRQRGRPAKKDDLRGAAFVLIEFWKRTHGKFTNGKWNGLEPIKGPAKFLFEELRLIDPKRRTRAKPFGLHPSTAAPGTGPCRPAD